MTENRIRIMLRADLEAPLHIAGPGRTVALVDRPIELDVAGYPLIPASSIRGRIRAELERLLRSCGQPVCMPPSPKQTCPHYWTKTSEGPPGLLCTACRIFGSAWYHAGVVNDDLRLSKEQRGHVDLLRMERTSVAMDRRLGVASSQRLFTTESTTSALNGAPLRFEGAMSGRLSDIHLGWLLAAVNMVIHAGGSKARGLGLLTLSVGGVMHRQEKVWQTITNVDELIEGALTHELHR